MIQKVIRLYVLIMSDWLFFSDLNFKIFRLFTYDRLLFFFLWRFRWFL